VAAPVFSEVTGTALRLLQVTPDNMDVNRNVASLKAMMAKRGNP
jgi:cell division protein FtsI (penicillin-binding protein 3)